VHSLRHAVRLLSATMRHVGLSHDCRDTASLQLQQRWHCVPRDHRQRASSHDHTQTDRQTDDRETKPQNHRPTDQPDALEAAAAMRLACSITGVRVFERVWADGRAGNLYRTLFANLFLTSRVDALCPFVRPPAVSKYLGVAPRM